MKALLAAFALLAWVGLANAQWTQAVTVSWDANPLNDAVDHYTVYWHVDLQDILSTTTTTNLSTRVTGLLPQRLYIFYVTASNAYGESDPSDKVPYAVKAQPPTGFSVTQ